MKLTLDLTNAALASRLAQYRAARDVLHAHPSAEAFKALDRAAADFARIVEAHVQVAEGATRKSPRELAVEILRSEAANDAAEGAAE